MKKATHKFFKDQNVKFSIQKDFLNKTEIKVIFSNGETTTMSEKRFEELYEINK